ncbi:MAG TPA: hypothetical protein VGB55_08740 [Tepidisphaeraceae bacterium]
MIARLLFIAALGVAGSTSARAEAPPSAGEGPAGKQPQDRTPRIGSPYWNDSSNETNDLPAKDIRAVAPARAAAVGTKWGFNQLVVDLSNATRVMEAELQRSPEYRDAVKAEQTAFDEMNAARQIALNGLKNNSAYTGAETLRSNLSEEIQEMHQEPNPDAQRLEAMARMKLNFAIDNRKLESDALARDSAFQDARRRYIAAATRLGEMRQDHAMAISTNDELKAIRQQVASARIEKLVAAAYLDSTVRARNIALRYDWARSVSERQRVGNGYPSYFRGGSYGYGQGVTGYRDIGYRY